MNTSKISPTDPGFSPAGIESVIWSTALRTRFRSLGRRDGLLIRGPCGWGEFSPFWDYDDAAAVPWLRAAQEAAFRGWPAPVRATVPVNLTIPAVDPETATALINAGVMAQPGPGGAGPNTAKVKVAQRHRDGALESLEAEVARVAAVRSALDTRWGPGVGQIRVDANGAWSVTQALEHLTELDHVAGGLQYAEQPCATVEELALLRRLLPGRGLSILIAADESIRRAADPMRVAQLAAADLVVLKVAPLGGVRACLELAEKLGLPVVVSSALESSIGIAAGVALAGALPHLPFACGLATTELLAQDLVAEPLRPVGGQLPVLPANHPRLAPEPVALQAATAPPGLQVAWQQRLARVARRAISSRAGD